jgi:peptidyl-prolyl cis-trans isomerase C
MAVNALEIERTPDTGHSDFVTGGVGRWRNRILREPLVHFFAVGLLLLALAEHHNAKADLLRIVVTPERVRQLTDGYRAEFGSTPTPRLLAQLIDRDIDEEVLYREGLARRLDRDDAIVRRRVVQKMRFLEQDLVAQPEPDEARLTAYYQAHRAQYATPATVSFSHIFFAETEGNPDAAWLRAQSVLAELSDTTARAPERGDNFPDLYDYAGFSAEQAKQVFGDSEISRRLFETSPGHWVGPVRSAFGWHLVRVQSAEPGKLLAFAAVRERVRADLIAADEAAANQRTFLALKARYTVVRADGVTTP